MIHSLDLGSGTLLLFSLIVGSALFRGVFADIPEVDKHIVNNAGDRNLLLRVLFMLAGLTLIALDALILLGILVDTNNQSENTKSKSQ